MRLTAPFSSAIIPPMERDQPISHRLHFNPVYAAVAREIGYQGAQYQDIVKNLVGQFEQRKIEVAVLHLGTFDREKNGDPKGIVQLRSDVRKSCFSLLGPAPEKWDSYYRNPDGSPRPEHAAKMAELEVMKNGQKKPEKQPEKKGRKKKDATIPAAGAEVRSSPHEGSLPQKKADLAPANIMQRYREAKERHPGMLLLFRMGDFYELFDQDAETAAKVLGLAITTRDKTMAMAGFPYHSLQANLQKLLQSGHRVAITEQVEEAPSKRVDRVVTPGSIVEEGPYGDRV